jgi:pimeloyl-ACP methyl ester carboxylesterase
MRTFEINGYRMGYVEEGRGEPLVMVHGSLSDYCHWARQARPRRTIDVLGFNIFYGLGDHGFKDQ